MQAPFSANSFRTLPPPASSPMEPHLEQATPASPPVGYLARRRILQLDESLAHRLPTNAKAGGDVLLRKPLAGRNLQLHDRELKGTGHLRRLRGRRC